MPITMKDIVVENVYPIKVRNGKLVLDPEVEMLAKVGYVILSKDELRRIDGQSTLERDK